MYACMYVRNMVWPFLEFSQPDQATWEQAEWHADGGETGSGLVWHIFLPGEPVTLPQLTVYFKAVWFRPNFCLVGSCCFDSTSMILKPDPIIIHQDISSGIAWIHGRIGYHAWSETRDSIQGPEERWEEVGRWQRLGQIRLLEQPCLCSVHTFACQRLGKIHHMFISTCRSQCLHNQSTPMPKLKQFEVTMSHRRVVHFLHMNKGDRWQKLQCICAKL